jgi:hypothetical protein
MAAGMTSDRFRCGSCGGEYIDVQRDGTIYFHSCGPLPRNADGSQPERPNKRDENVRQVRPTWPAEITSEGDGVTCLTNPNLIEPAWITDLKNRAAAAEAEE